MGRTGGGRLLVLLAELPLVLLAVLLSVLSLVLLLILLPVLLLVLLPVLLLLLMVLPVTPPVLCRQGPYLLVLIPLLPMMQQPEHPIPVLRPRTVSVSGTC